MSNEFDRLKQAFRSQENISARKNMRKSAISTAMKQFEKENSAKNTMPAQGFGIGNRLREQGNKLLQAINRRRVMNFVHPHFKHMLAGSVSVAVLAFAIVNIDQIIPDTAPPPLKPAQNKNAPVSQITELDEVKRSPEGVVRRRQDGEALPKDSSPSSDKPAKLQKNEAEVALLDSATSQADVPEPSPPVALLNDRRISRLVAPSPRKMAGESARLKTKSRQMHGNKGAVAYQSMQNGLVKKMAGESARSKTRSRQMHGNKGAVAYQSVQNGLIKKVDDVTNPRHYQDQGRDKFTEITPNPTKLVREDPVSTFSVDVDTASFAFVRSSLNRGVLPQKNAVRIEELINYFDYAYKAPENRAEPFSTNVSIMPTPWNAQTKLMRIGIKGYDLPKTRSPHANLVFLIDTSGSMNSPDKLPLLRNSFKLLLASLKPDDTVAIVTYAGSAGTALEPTRVADKNKILSALDRLNSRGSTAGAEGIRRAYQLAEQQMDKNGVNRVILATDGDFNVGITNPEELKNFVERKRKSGVTLSVLGFGHGNYNDQLMQALAQNGNGNAAYIDTLSEARKVLVEQAGATLFTIAKDVKLQVEFNPAMVSEYRLIGYETRQLKREDFNNDKIDAGDIGAGHSVTALYEMTPVGASRQQIDALRYQDKKTLAPTASKPVEKTTANKDEYAFMKIRYKLPDSNTSQLITSPVTRNLEASSIEDAPTDARFATAVAAFGQILRGGRNTGAYSYDDVIELALSAKGEDRFGYRGEFINLVRLAKTAAAL